MPRTRYGTSFWIDRDRRRAPKRPALKGDIDTDVAIVGGGLTGSLAACLFARAGIGVTLVEAGQAGATAGLDAGWIVEGPGVPFRTLQERHGLRVARRLYEASRRAALDACALVRRLEIAADLETGAALTIVGAPEDAAALQREQAARSAAGLEAVWLPVRRAAGESRAEGVRGALKTHGAGLVDPWKVCRGLLAAAEAAGAQIVERSPVTRVRTAGGHVEVVAARGTVRARTVVVATGLPRALVPALQRHVRVDHTYVLVTPPLPAALRSALPAGLVVRTPSPAWLALAPGGRLLIQGGDQPAVTPRLQDRALVQRVGQLMYEASLRYPSISGVLPEYAWMAPRVTARDGLLLAGPHRNFPRHLFALGLGATGLTGAFLAARLLLRHYTGEPEPGDEHFGFGR
jgi:gamma-glutamylputrescine oxidase